MIIWGGFGVGVPSKMNTGGRYNPSTNSWTATSTTGAPEGRVYHSAVWAGTEMIVWGGLDYPPGNLNSGGRYNPSTDNWIGTGNSNVPDGLIGHTAVWTGSEMIVWGAESPRSSPRDFNTGGRGTPGADSWTATSTTNAPSGRSSHTAVWTGTEMVVWGGYNSSVLDTGGQV